MIFFFKVLRIFWIVEKYFFQKMILNKFVYFWKLFPDLLAGAIEYADCNSNEATCWPWVAIHKALGRNPGGWAVIDLATEWSMLHATLALTWSDRRSDRLNLINRLVMSSPICFISTVVLNLHLQQVLNPYLLGARIWPVLRTWNWQRLGSLPSTRVYWSRIPVSTKTNGLPPWFIPNTSWTLC